MDATWWWFVAYFVTGFVVAVVTVKTSYSQDADDPVYAVGSMVLWPVVVVIALIYWLGVLIVALGGKRW